MRVTQTCRASFGLVLILAISAATAQTEAAAKKANILSMMPDNSLAFVVINDPALLVKKAGRLATQLAMPMPDPVSSLTERLPAIGHVDMTRPAAVALQPGGTPVSGVILIPVTDFDAFAKACGAEDTSDDLVKVEFAGHDLVAAQYDGYAVLTDASNASAIKAVKNNQGKVAGEFATMRERMESGDVMGGATRSGIETFAAHAKAGIALLQAQIREADADDLPGMPPESIAEALSIYTILVEEFDEAVETYAFALSIRKRAIVGRDMLRLKSSEPAKKQGQVAALDVDWCTQLPGGQPVFVMAGVTPKPMMSELLEFSKKAMLAMSALYGLDEPQIHQLIEDLKPLMEKTSGMAFMMSVPRNEDAPLYAGVGGIVKVQGGAEQYIDDYAKMITNLARAKKKPSGGAVFRFTRPRKIEVDGKTGIRLIVDFDFRAGAGDSEQQKMFDDMLAKMFGPDGKLKVFMVAANDDTVALGYTSRAVVKRFVAAANGELPRTLGSVPSYKQLGPHLPDDAQWFGAIDLGGYFQLIQRVVPPGTIPDLDIPACPIGIAVTASEQEVCVHGAITVNAIKRLVQAVKQSLPPSSGDQER